MHFQKILVPDCPRLITALLMQRTNRINTDSSKRLLVMKFIEQYTLE